LPSLTVQAARTPRSVGLDASVEAVRQTTLSAQVPGAVISLMVKAGDRVRAGQALLRLDAQMAQQGVNASAAQVEAAKAQLQVASRDHERQQQLFAKQYISQAALDRSTAQLDAAQAQVRALQAQTRASQAQTGYAVISAPYAGVVSEVPVALGDMVMPGRPLVTLYDPSSLRLTAAVPQALMAAARDPGRIEYQLGGADGAVTKSVSAELLPAVDPVSHTLTLRIPLPAATRDLLPGMYARIWIQAPDSGGKISTASRVVLPTSAVVRHGELVAVYVLDPAGTPRLRQVRVGPQQGDQVEVLSGLEPGERVVTQAQLAARAR
jgi:RND family efflux transporter MFP subunit